jgi:hypothetical protein
MLITEENFSGVVCRDSGFVQQIDPRGPKPQANFCNTRLWLDYLFIKDKSLFYQRFWPVISALDTKGYNLCLPIVQRVYDQVSLLIFGKRLQRF